MLKLPCFIPLLLFMVSASSQSVTGRQPALSPARTDALVKDLMEKAEVTGLCLGVVKNNRPMLIRAYGYRNRATKALMDTATSCYAASLAKSLFAYLVMQEVDKGVIDLDRPLYRYLPKPLPEYDNYRDLAGDDRWKLITARHCLSHTTGFQNWREFDSNGQRLRFYFTPGQFFAYSGEGIQLLQFVLETITGKKLEALAKENIFVPFGMRRTSFLWQTRYENDFAVGHNINEDTLAKRRFEVAAAAGSMETTIADYTRFMAAVLAGRRLTGAARTMMLTPQVSIKYQSWVLPPVVKDSIAEYRQQGLAYGLGWGLFQSSLGKAFFKEGQIDGWMHLVIGFPSQHLAYVIMTNSSNGRGIFKELVERLAGVTIPWKWEGYQPYRPAARLTASQLMAFTGEYDGRLKAIITLEGGKLKVSSPTVDLPPTTIYPANDHHLFLKIMEADFEFIKGADGKFNKIVADDEGEHYELKRVK